MKRWLPFVVAVIVAGLVAVLFLVRGCERRVEKPISSEPLILPSTSTLAVEASTATIEVRPSTPTVKPPIKNSVPKKQAFVPTPPDKKQASSVTAPTIVVSPTPVEIHKELIPKNIEIVRVYYAGELMGPGAETEFDINGTGFTPEFQQMIAVNSGLGTVRVKNLTYVTLNQIHGTLVVASTSPTSVGFPEVLINNKVVFRAPDPFAVIRPGEVLNVVFTEMGESGRSGRFRIYTNLTPEMFGQLNVSASTAAIQISELTPRLPFIVDATIQIGPALTGAYAMSVKLADRVIWERPGVIRIVQPDMGEAGLVQRLRATDGFYRPGDKAHFVVQGSGFQPQDAQLLIVDVPGLATFESTWTFVAPGRLDLDIKIPEKAPVNPYTINVLQGEKKLLSVDRAFFVVPMNWIRTIRVEPALNPGGSSALILEGRDLTAEFIRGLSFAFDEPGLSLDTCQLMDPRKAVAGIKASPNVAPGDYLVSMKYNGTVVTAFEGNVVRVTKK